MSDAERAELDKLIRRRRATDPSIDASSLIRQLIHADAVVSAPRPPAPPPTAPPTGQRVMTDEQLREGDAGLGIFFDDE